MALTEYEERIVKLLADELKTRKKLDAARGKRDADFRSGLVTVTEQVNEEHASVLSALQADFNAAEKAIEDEFK
jgi:hypothetical protein